MPNHLYLILKATGRTQQFGPNVDLSRPDSKEDNSTGTLDRAGVKGVQIENESQDSCLCKY